MLKNSHICIAVPTKMTFNAVSIITETRHQHIKRLILCLNLNNHSVLEQKATTCPNNHHAFQWN